MPDAVDFLHEEVHSLGGSVGGVEVGEQLDPSAAQGPAETGDLGDRAAGQDLDQLLGPPPALLAGGGVADRVDVLRDPPGEGDFSSRVTGGQRRVEPHPVLFGEVLGAAAQQPAALVERAGLVPAVPEGYLLHPAADLVEHVQVELYDVERIQHLHRRGQRVGQGGRYDRARRRAAAATVPGLRRRCPGRSWCAASAPHVLVDAEPGHALETPQSLTSA